MPNQDKFKHIYLHQLSLRCA